MRRGTKFTAEIVAFGRAAGTLEPEPSIRNPDVLARVFIRARFRVALLPGLRGVMQKVYDRVLPGMYLYNQARTRHMDWILEQELEDPPGQFVILGAGLDSRAYRFADRLSATRVFEVDHPGTAAWKQERLRRWKGPSSHVTFVTIDLTREKLTERLTAAGFEFGLRTFFLWEGVTYYLPESAVRETLDVLSGAAAGSALAFDYVLSDALDTPQRYFGAAKLLRYVARKGEPVLFGLAHETVPAFLSPYGYAPLSNVGTEELQARYLQLPGGRTRGALCNVFGIVHARKI